MQRTFQVLHGEGSIPSCRSNARSSNGRTWDFESLNLGSIPRRASNLKGKNMTQNDLDVATLALINCIREQNNLKALSGLWQVSEEEYLKYSAQAMAVMSVI